MPEFASDMTVKVTLDEVKFISRNGTEIALTYGDLADIVRLCKQVSGADNNEFDTFLAGSES